MLYAKWYYKIMNVNEKKRYIIYLNVIATFAVVLWHINDGIYSVSDNLSWRITVAVDSFVYFSVPVLFMITGANLIGYKERGVSLKEYFIRRIRKTFIPFLFWSLVFIAYYARNEIKAYIVSGNIIQLMLFVLESIFSYKYYTAFWFFIYLFVIYLAIPIIALVPERSRKRVFSVAAIAAFAVAYVAPFIFNILKIDFPINGSRFFLFVICGYLIDKYEMKRSLRIILYCLGLLALAIHYFGTVSYSLAVNELNSTFRAKDGLINCLYTIAIFTFFKYSGEKLFNKAEKVFNFFNRYTFGIYILHIFVLNEILPIIGIRLYDPNTNHIVMYPVAFVVIITICILATWVFSKIPLLKKVLPQ